MFLLVLIVAAAAIISIVYTVDRDGIVVCLNCLVE